MEHIHECVFGAEITRVTCSKAQLNLEYINERQSLKNDNAQMKPYISFCHSSLDSRILCVLISFCWAHWDFPIRFPFVDYAIKTIFDTIFYYRLFRSVSFFFVLSLLYIPMHFCFVCLHRVYWLLITQINGIINECVEMKMRIPQNMLLILMVSIVL